MKVLQHLTLGLASAATASAALCKPSTPSGPICSRNVVSNPALNGSIGGWTQRPFNGIPNGVLAGAAGTCGKYPSCLLFDTLRDSGGYVEAVQTIPNTGVGLTYTFSFDFRAVAALSSDVGLHLQIYGADANGALHYVQDSRWGVSDILVGDWTTFVTTFTSPSVNVFLDVAYHSEPDPAR